MSEERRHNQRRRDDQPFRVVGEEPAQREASLVPLAKLGLWTLESIRGDGQGCDGFAIKDKAVELDVIGPMPAPKPCGECCVCEEMGADTCVRDTPATIAARALLALPTPKRDIRDEGPPAQWDVQGEGRVPEWRRGPTPFPPPMPEGVKWRPESADPWKHRSSGMRCASCMWFVPKVPDAVKFPLMETQPHDLGRCRRHAPTMSGYPTVFVNDWCGDHKLDENKL